MNCYTQYRYYLLCLVFLPILFPLSAMALPAINCHCFTDRSYDSARPAAADPYLLATTQNSFFAAVFNVDKKTIVMKKQTGTSADDLWVAYWLASRSALTVEALLQAKQTSDTWQGVMVSLGYPVKSTDDRFSAELNAGASADRLAHQVVDSLLVRYRMLEGSELAEMRKRWATNQELIIAALIAGKTGQSPGQMLLDVKKGSRSWGALLNEAKIDTTYIQREISLLLKKLPR